MPTPVTTTPTTPTTPAAAPVTGNPKANLGKDDFLKLFVAQMTHQDPSKPMDNGAMMAQMASFSTLEQISNMSKASERVADAMGQSQSLSLIGKTVTYVDEAGATHTGKVEKVTTTGGASLMTVGGVPGIEPGWITEVS